MSNNLVEIRNNQVVVSSRQVAEKFEKEHKNVIRSLSSKLSGANKDRLSQHFYKDTYKDITGKSNTIYYMDRDGFSFLVMGFTGEKADKWKLDFIEAFNTMEKQLQTQSQLPNFNDPVASARAWADAMEAKQKALLELKEAQPKIEFAEAIQASNESISVSTFAKILKQNGIDTGERRLYEYLRNHGYLCSSAKQHNLPRQLYMEKGYFEVDTKVFKTPWTTKYTHIPKITPKGQEYFLNHFLKTKCE